MTHLVYGAYTNNIRPAIIIAGISDIVGACTIIRDESWVRRKGL